MTLRLRDAPSLGSHLRLARGRERSLSEQRRLWLADPGHECTDSAQLCAGGPATMSNIAACPGRFAEGAERFTGHVA
jgi:hypothetical protein